LLLIRELSFLEILFERSTGDVHLPENEGISRDVIECGLLFLLDHVLEGTDGLGAPNLDRKYVTAIIARNQTIECEM
jgi:hypothetical protein